MSRFKKRWDNNNWKQRTVEQILPGPTFRNKGAATLNVSVSTIPISFYILMSCPITNYGQSYKPPGPITGQLEVAWCPEGLNKATHWYARKSDVSHGFYPTHNRTWRPVALAEVNRRVTRRTTKQNTNAILPATPAELITAYGATHVTMSFVSGIAGNVTWPKVRRKWRRIVASRVVCCSVATKNLASPDLQGRENSVLLDTEWLHICLSSCADNIKRSDFAWTAIAVCRSDGNISYAFRPVIVSIIRM